MEYTNPGGDLIARLNIAGSLVPEVADLEAFLQGCGREETIGPLFHPDVHRRGQKRLRALAQLAKTGAWFRRAWEDLQEATAQEAPPEMDRAAQVERRYALRARTTVRTRTAGIGDHLQGVYASSRSRGGIMEREDHETPLQLLSPNVEDDVSEGDPHPLGHEGDGCHTAKQVVEGCCDLTPPLDRLPAVDDAGSIHSIDPFRFIKNPDDLRTIQLVDRGSSGERNRSREEEAHPSWEGDRIVEDGDHLCFIQESDGGDDKDGHREGCIGEAEQRKSPNPPDMGPIQQPISRQQPEALSSIRPGIVITEVGLGQVSGSTNQSSFPKRSREPGPSEFGSSEVGIHEEGILKFGNVEIALPQDGVRKIRLRKVSAYEVSTSQHAPLEIDPLEVEGGRSSRREFAQVDPVSQLEVELGSLVRHHPIVLLARSARALFVPAHYITLDQKRERWAGLNHDREPGRDFVPQCRDRRQLSPQSPVLRLVQGSSPVREPLYETHDQLHLPCEGTDGLAAGTSSILSQTDWLRYLAELRPVSSGGGG